MFRGTGKVIYDPHRPGMKGNTKWWVIVPVDREITRYYRWWVKKQFWVDLCQPSWDAHISVVRGEKPQEEFLHMWRKHHGKRIEFEYSHNVFKNDSNIGRKNKQGDFWLVEVVSPQLTAIRDELGLKSNWNFHITIGRTWY